MKTTFRDSEGHIHSADVYTPEELRQRETPLRIITPEMLFPLISEKKTRRKSKRKTRTVTHTQDAALYVLDIAKQADNLGAIGLGVGALATLFYLRGRHE